MILVGLTGGLGCGKSSVSALLAERGAVVIDADAIVHEIQQPGGRAYDGIVERFGPSVVTADGSLDRPAIAALIFNDEEARKDLNKLTHPHVGVIMAERMAANRDTDNVVVLDIPLLAEGGGRDRYGVAGILVVDCDPDVAVARVVEQRGMSEEDARSRQAAQAGREKRLELADFVVDNSGDRSHLEAEVDRAWKWMQSLDPVQPAKP